MPDIYFYLTLVIVILAFFALLSILRANKLGAPYLPTPLRKVRKMLTLANVQPGELVYDLGCGDGRFLIVAARRFKAKAIGIEINIIRYLWCQFLITVLFLRKRVKIKYGNLFNHDLSEADVVVCYLLQSTNDRLEDKLINELSQSARVVSNTFTFNSLPAIITDESSIYVYKIGQELENLNNN
jgi:predicted RNA methylase